MTFTQFVVIASLAIAYAVLAHLALRHTDTGERPGEWRLFAGLSTIFGLFSIYAVAQDGLMGFWLNHSHDLVGNQVWIDLLMAVGLAFALLVKLGRAHNMRIIPWAIFVGITASIGLYAMAARYCFLEARARQTA